MRNTSRGGRSCNKRCRAWSLCLERCLKKHRLFRDFRKMPEEGDLYQRKHLLEWVVEKVRVKGNEISAVTLPLSYHLIATGLKRAVEDSGTAVEGTRGDNDNREEKTTRPFNASARWLSGSDGRRMLSGKNLTLVMVPSPPKSQRQSL